MDKLRRDAGKTQDVSLHADNPNNIIFQCFSFPRPTVSFELKLGNAVGIVNALRGAGKKII